MRARNIIVLMVLVIITIIAIYKLFILPPFAAILRNNSVQRWVSVMALSVFLLFVLLYPFCVFFLPRLIGIWKRVFFFRIKKQFVSWTQELPLRHRAAAEKILSFLSRQQLERELMNVSPDRWEWLLMDWDRALATPYYRQQLADWEEQRGQEQLQRES